MNRLNNPTPELIAKLSAIVGALGFIEGAGKREQLRAPALQISCIFPQSLDKLLGGGTGVLRPTRQKSEDQLGGSRISPLHATWTECTGRLIKTLQHLTVRCDQRRANNVLVLLLIDAHANEAATLGIGDQVPLQSVANL